MLTFCDMVLCYPALSATYIYIYGPLLKRLLSCLATGPKSILSATWPLFVGLFLADLHGPCLTAFSATLGFATGPFCYLSALLATGQFYYLSFATSPFCYVQVHGPCYILSYFSHIGFALPFFYPWTLVLVLFHIWPFTLQRSLDLAFFHIWLFTSTLSLAFFYIL